MIGLWIFDGRVGEAASARVRLYSPRRQPLEQRSQLGARLPWVGRDGLLEPIPEFAIVVAQIGGCQFVLRSKVAIEARLGHPGAGDDLVDPDGPDPFPVEQVARGLPNAVGRERARTLSRFRSRA